MPSRVVREGILTSERVNSLSPNAELFYRRLMSVVDDFGRFSANLTLLRASCYPLKLDGVKEDSISKHLAECVGARLVVLYTVEGKAFLELQDFRQQVRAKVSKFPAPAEHVQGDCFADAEHPSTDVHLGGGGGGVEDGGGNGADPDKPDQPPAILLPLSDKSEFAVTEDHVAEFESLYPAVDVRAQLREMRGWCIGNPTKRKTRAGILRFVTNWLSREQDKGGSRLPPNGSAPAPERRRELL